MEIIKLRKKNRKKKKLRNATYFLTREYIIEHIIIYSLLHSSISSPFATPWRKNYFKEILINIINEAPRLISTCEDFITTSFVDSQKPYNNPTKTLQLENYE